MTLFVLFPNCNKKTKRLIQYQTLLDYYPPDMATLRNKRKLAAANREDQEEISRSNRVVPEFQEGPNI